MKLFCNLLFLSTCYSVSVSGANPNPPTWPASVHVFTTLTPTATIQSVVDTVFTTNGGQTPPDHGQFVNQGYAFLFAPGTYTGLNIRIGYYTQILGMGMAPGETGINSVSSPQGNNDFRVGALNSFWRSAENFSTTPALPWAPTTDIGMTWAVSQAAPLRRVQVNGVLYLFQLTTPNFEAGFASGGFMADCTCTGTSMNQSAIVSGTQQQWISRNCNMTVPTGSTHPAWSNGVWNQVFVGCTGAPASHCGRCSSGNSPSSGMSYKQESSACAADCTGNPYTNVAATPVIAEKPFITSDSTATIYTLVIPQIEQNKVGTSQENQSPTISVDFSQVYVATAAADTAATINAQLNMGYHVVLTPGTYNLTAPIEIHTENAVLLGIGFPILISTTGQPCIVVGSVSGVRVGGILLQAGPSTNPVAPTLLRWGPMGGDPAITNGFLYDCFTRIGRFSGNSNESFNHTDLMIQINSDNVVCDNLWLWRGDHDSQGLVFNGDNPCNTGAQINGNHVIIYGLGCEHTLQDLTQWNGNQGRCYFFQSEFPYDVNTEYGTSGYTGYRVGNAVTEHTAFGVGVYCFFRDHFVRVNSGIVAPLGSGIRFTNSLTRFLSGYGGISSVLNTSLGVNPDQSSSAVTEDFPGPAYLCDYSDQTVAPRIRKHRRG